MCVSVWRDNIIIPFWFIWTHQAKFYASILRWNLFMKINLARSRSHVLTIGFEGERSTQKTEVRQKYRKWIKMSFYLPGINFMMHHKMCKAEKHVYINLMNVCFPTRAFNIDYGLDVNHARILRASKPFPC